MVFSSSYDLSVIKNKVRLETGSTEANIHLDEIVRVNSIHLDEIVRVNSMFLQ